MSTSDSLIPKTGFRSRAEIFSILYSGASTVSIAVDHLVLE